MAFLPLAIPDPNTEIPDGQRHNWNDGRQVNENNAEEDAVLGSGAGTIFAYRFPRRDGWSHPLYTHNFEFADDTRGIDDVGFLSALVDIMVNGSPDGTPDSYECNPDRIYMVGVSNGGTMAQRFVLEEPGKIAAVVVGASELAENLEAFETPVPAPILLMLGEQDAHVRFADWDTYANASPPLGPVDPSASPHEGGWVCIPEDENDACTCERKVGRTLTASETAEFWAARNGCELLDQDTIGDTTIDLYQDGCLLDYQVLVYSIADQGHTWSGNTGFPWPTCAQEAGDDVAGEEEAWAFFQQYPYWQDATVEECIVDEAGESSQMNEGFWRGKLRVSSSGANVPVTIKLRGIPILKQIPLGPPTQSNELALIWRMYDDGATPAADDLWTRNGMTIASDGTIRINIAQGSKVLKGSAEQWLEIVVPDYDLNDDGLVNFLDAGKLLSYSNAIPPVYAFEADFNRDGAVDNDDKDMMSQSFLTQQSCGSGNPGPDNPIACPLGTCGNYPDMDP